MRRRYPRELDPRRDLRPDKESPGRTDAAPDRRHYGGNPDTQVVFGLKPVKELIAAAPETVRVLHIRARGQARFEAELERVRKSGGQVRVADEATLSRVAGRGARHQGIAATIRGYGYASLERVLGSESDPIVIVDGVTDPRNLGAILRSVEGAGARSVIVARDRTCPMTPAAIKSSAGAWVHLQIARCGNVARLIADLKEAGYWVVALTPSGETSIYELDSGARLALVVGSEGRGVRELVAKSADFRVSIPMRGRINSLNVSVAAAVALFEIARKRAEGQSQRIGREAKSLPKA